MEILQQLKSSIVNKPGSFDDCIAWARIQFQDYYHNTICQLLFNFPSDHVDSKLNASIVLMLSSSGHFIWSTILEWSQEVSQTNYFWSHWGINVYSRCMFLTVICCASLLKYLAYVHVLITVDFTHGLCCLCINIVC